MAKIKNAPKKISTCLWFNTNAEEAVKYYLSVFKNSKKGKTSFYPEGSPMPEGSVLTIEFRIEGQEFLALNGGPEFKFTEAVSFVLSCKTQKEIDHYWEKLSKEGSKGQCGWLKDKFGLSWQVVPAELNKMVSSQKAGRSARVMKAIMKMKKLDIAKLKKAYEG